ncbi:DNA polymerase [Winogradskyella sp. 4-2091]|uniref:DNA polymerase n=1 Tax=Winogradskyella sp. 4-2091 TaxID=3381659 RepID=UPI003891B511
MNQDILDLEYKTLHVVMKMELDGVKIDTKKCKQTLKQLSKLNKTLIQQIQIFAEEEINLESPLQLHKLLFETLQLQPKVDKVGKNGCYSTDKSHLKKLTAQHEIVPLLLDYRKTISLINFCKQLHNVNPITKRLHGQFNQIGTSTGRFSCSKPNLQNIPNPKLKKDETNELKILESRFREMFIPKKGCQFICADYSQIEIRVVTDMSQDKYLLRAYTTKDTNGKNLDVHRLTASEVFNIKYSEVTDEQRSIAKSVNFGLIYGKTAFGLSATLTEITGKHHSKEQAEDIMSKYFQRFSGVKTCLDDLIDFADKHGYSETIYGRRRPIPQLSSSKLSERNAGKRLAMNSPVQGSAADIIKMAMVACDEQIKTKNLKSKLVLQVHDELLFEVPDDEMEVMETLVKNTMETVVRLSIPLEVGLDKGHNWAMAH